MAKSFSKWDRAPSTKKIHADRLRNLTHLVAVRYNGNGAALAKVVGKSHTFIWQLLKSKRAIGENTARYIEQKAKLGHRWLDEHGSSFEPTKLMTVHFGDGETENYPVLPWVELKPGLRERAGRPIPCPVPCKEGSVIVRMPTDSLEPDILKGEFLVLDDTDNTPEDGKFYVVQAKGEKDLIVRQAQHRDGGGFRFVTRKGNGDQLTDHDVKVIGRVIYAMRRLP